MGGTGERGEAGPFFAIHPSLKLPPPLCELRRTGLRACELRRARWNLGGADFGWGGDPGDVREKRVAWLGWAAWVFPIFMFVNRRAKEWAGCSVPEQVFK